MENTFGNNIHKNQIYPILASVPNIHGLFINPIIEVSRKRIGIIENRNKIKNATLIYSPFPTYFFFSQWFILPWIIIWSCVPLILICIKKRIKIIHARNLISGICAIIVGKIIGASVVVDVRGIHSDEGVLIGRWKHKDISYRFHKLLETWILNSASEIICISPNLCRYVSLLAPNARPKFIPAMVDPNRIYYSKSLHIEARMQLQIAVDDLCLVYTGSLGAWHHIDALRKQIITCSDSLPVKKVVVIILTNENPNDILSQLKLNKRVIVRSVAPDEVNYYLNAADVGLLPARPIETESHRMVFDVMISSKAEEYLCTGLAVYAHSSITYFQNKPHARKKSDDRYAKSLFYQNEFANDKVIDKIQKVYEVIR